MNRNSRVQILPTTRLLLLAILVAPFAFVADLAAQGAAPAKQASASPRAPQSPAPGTKLAQPGPATSPSASQVSPADPEPGGIEADTKKLYLLSMALRAEVGKTYKQSLSVDVLRKAQELERLAKSLRSEMDHQASAKKR